MRLYRSVFGITCTYLKFNSTPYLVFANLYINSIFYLRIEQALRKHTNRGYSEVDGFSVLLHFKTHSAGMCEVASHPRWGTRFYPATIFTTAPYDILRKILLGEKAQTIAVE